MKYIFLLLFFPLFLHAQLQIEGVVKDSDTQKVLPFATISVAGEIFIADVDGKFTITANEKQRVTVSYLGHRAAIFSPDDKDYFYTIYLQQTSSTDTESIANSIIKQAVQSQQKNDPKKKLPSFDFKAYRKLIITADPDAVPSQIDTIITKKFLGRKKEKIDSSRYKFQKFVSQQHLFETEKISHYQFDGNNFKETILAAKMAGFEEPVYEVVGFNLQSMSLYEPTYEIFGTKYMSPLSRSRHITYKSQLLDTLKIGGRDSYMIHYKNFRRGRKSGLQGLLFIDAENHAVVKAVMRVRGVLNVSGIHEYQYYQEQDLWLPAKQTFKITKGHKEENMNILGSTIIFDDLSESNINRSRQPSDETYLLSESTISDVKLSQPVSIKNKFIAVEIKDSAVRNNELWSKFKNDSIDRREANTYRALDSIVAKRNIVSKLLFGRKIINGYVPFGPFDLDLRYLLSFNNFEGFRIGIGGITNDRLSEKFRIESYTAYGTKDGEFKYSVGAMARVGKFSDTWIGASHTNDLKEIASTTFIIDPRIFKIYDPRPINISTFYNHITNRAYVRTKIIPKTESIWQLSQSRIDPYFNYGFYAKEKLYTTFHLMSAVVSLQWNPFSDYMQTPKGRIETAKRFPKFTFQYTQTLDGLSENDLDFGKLDIRTEYEKKFLNGQKSALLIEAGYAYGDTPLTHLYNTAPNNLTNDVILQRITLSGKNSFETMYFNEFFSDKYVLVQLKHGLRKFELFNKVKPAVVLVTRMAWGTMDNPEDHLGLEFKTLEEGYYESGFELNQIFTGFGISAFYRYGPNQLSNLEDNIAVKLTFLLNLGF
jgi:hypothetical protein